MNPMKERQATMDSRRVAVSKAAAAWRAAMVGAAVTLLGALSLGCGGPSVEDVCNEWDKRDCAGWDGKSACVSAGDRLESTAHSAGCDEDFQAYLKCVSDTTSCNWSSACSVAQKAVEACMGSPF